MKKVRFFMLLLDERNHTSTLPRLKNSLSAFMLLGSVMVGKLALYSLKWWTGGHRHHGIPQRFCGRTARAHLMANTQSSRHMCGKGGFRDAAWPARARPGSGTRRGRQDAAGFQGDVRRGAVWWPHARV